MNFASMVFVFCFLALYLFALALCRDVKGRNRTMLVLSLIFYAWAGIGFLLILLADTAICWILARGIQACRSPRGKKALLALCMTLMLGVLGVFKYLGFFLTQVQLLIGIPKAIPTIALPLGISFYTFQLLSYVADVYRGDVPAQPRYSVLLLYASLFHQCVAGPIVRYRDILHDMATFRREPDALSQGIRRFCVGLIKKVVLADGCGAIADICFAQDALGLARQSVAGLWLSGLAYALQIYLDFSAYSDMALGLGLMGGFHYRENFRYPYIATSVTDFWRRWHISLSSFFRDYVYIPLGGSRHGLAKQIRNLFIVWALTGLWHGASWNFVLWGLFFFCLLTVEKLVGGRLHFPRILGRVGVLTAVFFSWLLFRFQDLGQLGTVLRGMFGANGNPGVGTAWLDLQANWILLAVCIVACTPLGVTLYRRFAEGAKRHALVAGLYCVWEFLAPVAALIIAAMTLAGNSYRPFLYFIF